MGLSRSVSEIDGDFSRKSPNSPLYFSPPLKGFPLELGIGAGVKKTRMMGLLGRQRSLTISSVVWIEGTNVTDRHFIFISEIFIVEKCQKCRDLDLRVKGHSRSLKVVPFYRLCMISYSCVLQ